MSEGIKIKGTYRLHIEDPDGSIVGDSDWLTNTVTNNGFRDYLVLNLTGTTGSLQVSHINVGTGTDAVLATAVALLGEVVGTNAAVQRAAITSSSSSSSKTVQIVATLSSANSFVTATETIGNVGLFGHTTTDNLFAGNTYATSTVATNQNVNLTYDIAFS
jgi:hypothetical protein